MRRHLTACGAVLLLFVGALPALAQTQLGSIVGVVKDDQGGALPGVAITLTGKAGSRTATTDASGEYRFPALDAGAYEVKAELTGFKVKRAGVIVSIGAQSRADFSLSVGSVTESVDVVGEAPVVDTTSAATSNSLSQDILYNMPIDRRSFNVYNFAPGINNASAYGGGSSTSNALLLDGVDTRDPDGGTDWSFFNYNIIQEVQVQGLGAPAEYGGFTGAIVNTVTKSGGNRTAGLFDFNYTKSALSSDNVTSSILAQDPALGTASKVNKYLDVTGQLSGPIQQDKLFFFISAQRFLKNEDPTGPRTTREEISHRANLKLNWNPNNSDQFVASAQFDDYNIRGRCDLASDFACNDTLTDTEDAPEWVWNTQWRHLFSSSTFLEAKYVGWWGYYNLDPTVNAPGHFDGETGNYSVSWGEYAYYDRGRHQVNASLSHYADGWGKHELKFGVEIERSRARNRFGYTGGVTYYDYGGEPYLAYSYSYDVEGHNHRDSAYLQDSWKVNDRLTINPGLRFDWVRGLSPALNKKVFDTKSWGPRIGIAYDLTGDHNTVLKGFYGQYYEGASFEYYVTGVPGVGDYVTYDNTVSPREEIDRSATPVFSTAPNIKQPRVDEFNLGFERAFAKDWRLSVTGVYRKNKNYIDKVYPGALWDPIQVQNGLTGQPATAYAWANRDETQDNGVIQNLEGFQYLDTNGNVIGTANPFRTYRSLMVVLNKRLTNRWQTQASYVLSKTEGTLDNTTTATYGNSFVWASPTTALINTDGRSTYDQTHEVKVYATYIVPKAEVALNVYFRNISGPTYTPYLQLSGSTLNFPQSQRGRRLLLAPRGSYRLDTERIVDVRLEKIFKIGRDDRISVYADITNLFNASTVTDAIIRYPSQSTDALVNGELQSVDVPFGSPAGLIAPRQVTFGARWQF
jgi:Carboxypeptidase regulatory-like domain/TonB dependent receptor-like, beta-barrel